MNESITKSQLVWVVIRTLGLISLYHFLSTLVSLVTVRAVMPMDLGVENSLGPDPTFLVTVFLLSIAGGVGLYLMDRGSYLHR